MIQLLRLLKGYVVFCAEGGFSERFINLCHINGISLWNVQNDGVKVRAFTTVEGFALLEEPAKNSGMTLKIERERGLRFFIKRHKWRCGAAFGIIFVLLFLVFMSGFIWEVEVVEADGVNVENFTESLAELGVKPGVRKSKIDILEVQNSLMEEYGNLLWVSLNIFGGKAQVEITVAVEEKDQVDTHTPVNIVAKKQGTVTLVKGYFGENVVKEGESVTEGQLLISGVVANSDGSEKFVRAGGEVLAETKSTVKSVRNYSSRAFVTDGSDLRYSLYAFGLEIPFGKKAEGDFECENEILLKSGETSLPVGILRNENMGVVEKTVDLNEREACLSALLYAVSEKRQKFSAAELINVVYCTEKNDKAVSVISEITCIEDIATEKAIELE